MREFRDTFERIHRLVRAAFPMLKPVRLRVGCSIAERDYTKVFKGLEGQRIMAHTGHQRNTVCVSRRMFRLARPYWNGILLHEFGHLISIVASRSYREDDADFAIWGWVGIPIRYRGPLELQHVTDLEIKRAESKLLAAN